MMNNEKFKNKIALVTGSTRGIGKAIAQKLAEKGAVVYLNSRTSSEGFALEKLFTEQGLKVFYIRRDISCAEEVRTIFETIKKNHGKLDILVNNAGIFSHDDLDYSTYANLHKVNGYGVFLCCTLASEFMETGTIINISSIYGISPNPNALLASAVKAEVEHFIKAFAKKYLGKIQVNSIAPGYTDTGLLYTHFDLDKIKKITEQTPIGRLIRVNEVAEAALWLLSNEAITGQTLVIDGGYTVLH